MGFRPDARLDPGQVQDRRGRGGTIAIGGGLGGIALIVIALLLGVDPTNLPIDTTVTEPGANPSSNLNACTTGAEANQSEDCRIVGYVNSVQAYWSDAFGASGEQYTAADTVLFSGGVSTGCGQATSAVGPFYCPADQQIYLDLGFFDQLETRFGAEGGRFAEAYVVAHEYGHHVQNLLGALTGSQDTGPESQAVAIELQADCYAGAWAGNAVETGFIAQLTDEDIAQALDAAAAVGDDRIQEATTGQVNPELWTHGSAEQRQQWVRTGYETADPSQCTP
jgi:predicted metalloprotease